MAAKFDIQTSILNERVNLNHRCMGFKIVLIEKSTGVRGPFQVDRVRKESFLKEP